MSDQLSYGCGCGWDSGLRRYCKAHNPAFGIHALSAVLRQGYQAQADTLGSDDANYEVALQRAAAIILKLRGCAEDEIDDAIIASLVDHELREAPRQAQADALAPKAQPLRTADIVGVGGWDLGTGESWLAQTPEPPKGGLSLQQKMFVLLAEIRQCINDDHLMAAQRKVMAVEQLLTPRTQDKDADWFLVRAGETAPLTGRHGSWVETDHPAVVACMGSDPACAAEGCQLRRQVETLRAQVEALKYYPGPTVTVLLTDVLALLDARAKL